LVGSPAHLAIVKHLFRLCLVVVALTTTTLWAKPAWAAFGDGQAGGPEVLQTAVLSASPSIATPLGTGCGSTSLQTTVSLNWTDSQSSTPDASGRSLVSGYTVSRASASTGPYGTAVTLSGNPPATSATDTPTVASSNALVADATAAGSKLVYPYSESTQTAGTGISIGTSGTESNALQITPDGQAAVLAEATTGQVQILSWSGTAWSVAKTLALAKAIAVAISPVTNGSGHYVAYVVTDPGATSNGTVVPVTVNGASSALGAAITVQHQADPTAITVTPNGQVVYVTNYGSGTVSAIATATSTASTVSLPGTTPGPFALTVTPDSSHVYAADRANSYVDDILVSSNTVSTHIALPANALKDTVLTASGNPNAMAMLPTALDLYVAEFGSAQVQELSTALASTPDAIVATISTGGGTEPIDIALSPNGCTLYVSDWPTNNIFAVTTSTNAVKTAFTATCETQDPQPMEVTSDNAYLLVPENYNCGDLQVYNASSGAVTTLNTVGAHPAQVAVQPVDLWYEVTATHNLWTSSSSTPAMIPVGWNPGGWQ
jgi:YVTN family beta-propeller protein